MNKQLKIKALTSLLEKYTKKKVILESKTLTPPTWTAGEVIQVPLDGIRSKKIVKVRVLNPKPVAKAGGLYYFLCEYPKGYLNTVIFDNGSDDPETAGDLFTDPDIGLEESTGLSQKQLMKYSQLYNLKIKEYE